MKWGWLKHIGIVGQLLGTSAHPIIRAVIASANAIEVVAPAKGKAKEDAALELVPALLRSYGLESKVNSKDVQDAIRKCLKAYVEVQNTKAAAEEAVEAFEDAKVALQLLAT